MIVLFVTILLVSFNLAAESEPATKYMLSVILARLPGVFHTLGWPCHRYGSCHRCCFPRSGAGWCFKTSPTPDSYVGSCVTDALLVTGSYPISATVMANVSPAPG